LVPRSRLSIDFACVMHCRRESRVKSQHLASPASKLGFQLAWRWLVQLLVIFYVKWIMWHRRCTGCTQHVWLSTFYIGPAHMYSIYFHHLTVNKCLRRQREEGIGEGFSSQTASNT
jgi:hypothetical protein